MGRGEPAFSQKSQRLRQHRGRSSHLHPPAGICQEETTETLRQVEPEPWYMISRALMDIREPLKESKRHSNWTSQVDTESQFMSPRKSIICKNMKFLLPADGKHVRQALKASGVNNRGSPRPNSGKSFTGILTFSNWLPNHIYRQHERSAPRLWGSGVSSHPFTLGLKTKI